MVNSLEARRPLKRPTLQISRRTAIAAGAAALSMPLAAKSTRAASFTLLPGRAQDIGVGANGAVFVIGSPAVPSGDGGIFRWNGLGWTQFSGFAKRIAVDPNGNPYVTTSSFLIFGWTGTSWVQLPLAAQDIGYGASGLMWMVSPGSAGVGDGEVYLWDPITSSWSHFPGRGTRIAVDPMSGLPWVVNSKAQIFAYASTDGAFVGQIPGAAVDIACPQGKVPPVAWITAAGAANNILSYYIGSSGPGPWMAFGGQALQIAADANGNPWVVTASGQIYGWL